MKRFTNPLDKIKIASPCSADWDEMFGDERKRHCAECRLNVYNLSEMTQVEAENFLINSEGRVCLKIYRRTDGTVITKDCPVGWAKLKRKTARAATAVFTLVAAFFGGVLGLESLKTLRAFTNYKKVPEIFFETNDDFENGTKISFGGMANNLSEIKAEILKNRDV